MDPRIRVIVIAPRSEGHHDLFQRAIPSAFANPVDGTLDLAGAVFNRRQAIRHGQSQIIMAVDANHRPIDIRDTLDQGGNHLAHVRGGRVAHGIRDVDRRCAGVDGCFHDSAEEIQFRPCGILRGKLHILTVPGGLLHAGHRAAHDFVGCHFQFEFAMNRAGRQEDVDPWPVSRLQGLPGPVNVSLVAASETADGRVADVTGDFLDRGEVAGRSDGKTGFDDVHAQVDQRVGDLQLFIQVHTRAGGLLSVSQRGIKDSYGPRVRHSAGALYKVQRVSDVTSRQRAGRPPAREVTTSPSSVVSVDTRRSNRPVAFRSQRMASKWDPTKKPRDPCSRSRGAISKGTGRPERHPYCLPAASNSCNASSSRGVPIEGLLFLC